LQVASRHPTGAVHPESMFASCSYRAAVPDDLTNAFLRPDVGLRDAGHFGTAGTDADFIVRSDFFDWFRGSIGHEHLGSGAETRQVSNTIGTVASSAPSGESTARERW